MAKKGGVQDQWATTGAPNFESALAIAAGAYENLTKVAQSDIWMIVVDRAGSIFPIGSGEVFQNNEEAPAPQGFIVMKDDITAFLQAEEVEGSENAEDEGEDEDEEESDEDEEAEEESDEDDEEGAEENDDDTPSAEDDLV